MEQNLDRVSLPKQLQASSDMRTLGESRRMLSDLAGQLWSTVELISGTVLVIASYEAKLTLGFHLYGVVNTLAAIEGRLSELGAGSNPHRTRTVLQSAEVARMLEACDEACLVSTIYWRLIRGVVDGVGAYLEGGCYVADGPSMLILRSKKPDLEDMLSWAQSNVQRHKCDKTSSRVMTRSARPRPLAASRDPRLTCFSRTRSYETALADLIPDGCSQYEKDRATLACVNRDEIDAVETFALVVFDLLFEVPLEMLVDLSRTAWDEVRHSLLGKKLLDGDQEESWKFPCSLIGIDVRSRLGGWDALAQISLFGELSIIGPMRALAYQADAESDEVTASTFGFICSDESLHLRRIRRWLKSHHPLGDIDEIERHTQREAAKVLAALGVMDEDYYLSLSPQQIFELLGE